MSVAQAVRDTMRSAPDGERKVARAMLAGYPTAALRTVADLAERAGVSSPTVMRFTTRLGFTTFPAFQDAVLAEVQATVERQSAGAEHVAGDAWQATVAAADDDSPAAATAVLRIAQAVRATALELPRAEIERAVALLADRRRRVLISGGRFSQLVAEYAAAHLEVIRPEVRVVARDETARLTAIAEAQEGAVTLVALDFRRYDQATVAFVQQMAEAGAEVVLLTDRWLSPAARWADVVLPTRVETDTPFDTLVPSVALVESLVAATVDALGESGRARLERIEALRNA